MMNEIKNLEGIITIENCLDALLLVIDSFGDVWETHVDCGKCPFAKSCDQIKSAFLEIDAGYISCSQVVDILLGNKTVDEVLASL